MKAVDMNAVDLLDVLRATPSGKMTRTQLACVQTANAHNRTVSLIKEHGIIITNLVTRQAHQHLELVRLLVKVAEEDDRERRT